MPANKLARLCESIALKRKLSKSLRVGIINRLCPDFMKGYEFETGFFGFRYRGNTQNLIDRKVLFSGCHECDVLAFIRDFMAMLDKPVCIDIGANIGHHALFMSKHANKVLAFEPYGPVRQSLQEKLELNHISNVDIYPVALGEKNESKQFFAPPEGNLGMGSFVEEFSNANRSDEKLDVRRGDDFFAELGIERADFIKLDVEGFEKEVLSGAQETLARLRPVVLFESSIRLDNALHSMQEIEGIFPEDYRYFRFTHIGKRRHGKYKLVELSQDMIDGRDELAILAVPVERKVPMSASIRILPG
ncbi:MAG: FkbM family methyltransferase [Gammaproteobacteria bacterium]|nr:FkbM family methyltransferase [Gammaproteobacteria bacterium]